MEDGMSSIYFSSYKADKAWNFEEMVSTIDPIWKNTFFFYIHELDVIQHQPYMDMERHSLLAKSALLKNFTDMQN